MGWAQLLRVVWKLLACENGAPPDWIIVAVAVAVVAVAVAVAVAVVAAVVVTVAVAVVVVVVVVWFVLEIDLGDIDHLLGNNKQHRVDDLQDVHQLVLRHKNIEDLHLGHELLDLFHCAPLLPGLQASHLRQRWRRTPVELLIEDVKELPLAVFWPHGALCCTCSTTSFLNKSVRHAEWWNFSAKAIATLIRSSDERVARSSAWTHDQP